MATIARSAEYVVAEWMRDKLVAIPDVHTVYTAVGKGEISLWFCVSRYEQDVKERLYDLKEALYSEFPDAVFDIHILAKPLPPKGQELFTDADVVYRREAA